MPTTATVKKNGIIQINLTVNPADGDLSSLTYSADPTGKIAWLENSTGVQVKGLAEGTTDLTASVYGVDENGDPATIEATCTVTVTVGKPKVKGLSMH